MSPMHPLSCIARRFSGYWFEHWLDPRNYVREIISLWQRAFRGYSDCDLWNMDLYVAELISKMAHQLADTTYGYPPDLTPAEWRKILHTIGDGFYPNEDFLGWQPSVGVWDLLRERFRFLWD
jgi:hypothetical protein